MDAVIQEQPSGCGIAACAALAQIDYAQARQLANSLGIHAEDPQLWSDATYVRRLLSHLGITANAEQTLFSNWQALPNRALLAIKWRLHNGRPFWHWVVFVREAGECYVLDSKKALKHNRRQDFGRMKPKWFIAIGT
ncbi:MULTISPECIES: hypothetical protein [Pseudomonas]|uniref:Peptidase C39 domain-containing protein n=1 Tax=Pseudomonas donghuensis TaxID=1163398 RepID=A0AAP0XBL9_9PSED|nr:MULTISPECIES: hypothetical protein [Pseudomonas]MDF9892497.1 ABC-type bacteriocin/lantibiotic exporter with double-glycine peptidase domain [Pseudomonas vranovensis]KDO01059.1 hypothetical protein BV82_0926 [Pseudomonas donghuensis]MBF4207627.1 hypothetical protein [Pseudomonas donghuensis]MBS7600147.1 hypothetical protein [Pseudomonas sp. RC2C2]MCP6692026.1 hypothetical protein [Pseudomonas donghuensis]